MSMFKHKHKHYDAIVVGARCAGSATALELARMGARVLIIDRDLPENDTLSTHALMRPAVAVLADWGLLDEIENAGAPLVNATRFYYGTELVPVLIRPQGRVRGLCAPRRYVLDRILADAAMRVGAELHTGVTFLNANKDVDGRVVGAQLAAPDGNIVDVSATILIGADGRMSSLARSVGACVQVESPERTTAVYGYFHGIENLGYRWYFGDQSYAGAIPTNDGNHCVFAGVRPEAFKTAFATDPIAGRASIIAQCDDEFAAKLPGLALHGRLRRFGGAPGHMRDCAGPGWALVGDAGYFKDPATAHGITDAFLDARRLARAIAHAPDHPADYQIQRNAMSRPLFDVTRRIAALDWSLDEAKALHLQLNDCMKSEFEELCDTTPMAANAA
jgi:2-polyprenyl-6-methoxyphenol hydroxylase-like FAD-dependent oxidoreductase